MPKLERLPIPADTALYVSGQFNPQFSQAICLLVNPSKGRMDAKHTIQLFCIQKHVQNINNYCKEAKFYHTLLPRHVKCVTYILQILYQKHIFNKTMENTDWKKMGHKNKSTKCTCDTTKGTCWAKAIPTYNSEKQSS